jgi:hypothetical protein
MNKRIFTRMKAMGRDFRVDCATELEDAKFGRITPEEAEQKAIEKGFILSIPFKDFELDDSKLAVWTLEMTAAWIISRDRVSVLRHYEPSYKVARGWVPNRHRFPVPRTPVFTKPKRGHPGQGHDLVSFGPTNVIAQYYEYNGEEASFDRERGWWDTLHKELVAGRIRASGHLCFDEWAQEKNLLDSQSGPEQERLKLIIKNVTEEGGHGGGIPKTLWRYLSTHVEHEETVVRYQNVVLYRDLRFSAEEVMEAFHADGRTTSEYRRAQLYWRYREPPEINGDMSIAIAAWIRSEHINGFPRTKPTFSEVKRIIKENDVDNDWGFEDRAESAYRKFVQRLMDQLLEEDYSASR